MKDIFEQIVEQSKTGIPLTSTDYIGEDGLLYCGKCHTAKQCVVELLGESYTPYCLCDCEAERQRQNHEEYLRSGKRLQMLDNCFLYDNMRNWTFANDKGLNPPLIDACKAYAESFFLFEEEGRGLLLYGKCGTGKTYAAGCIANFLIDEGTAVKFRSVSQLANEMMDGRKDRNAYMESLASYPLLVLDDLASERQTEFMDEVVREVIDARCATNKPLVVTTNMTAEDLRKPKDLERTRIVSRLYERCIPVEAKGSDLRQSALAKGYRKFKEMLGIGGDL